MKIKTPVASIKPLAPCHTVSPDDAIVICDRATGHGTLHYSNVQDISWGKGRFGEDLVTCESYDELITCYNTSTHEAHLSTGAIMRLCQPCIDRDRLPAGTLGYRRISGRFWSPTSADVRNGSALAGRISRSINRQLTELKVKTTARECREDRTRLKIDAPNRFVVDLAVATLTRLSAEKKIGSVLFETTGENVLYVSIGRSLESGEMVQVAPAPATLAEMADGTGPVAEMARAMRPVGGLDGLVGLTREELTRKLRADYSIRQLGQLRDFLATASEALSDIL